jgi:hypothetical protein
MRAGTVVIILWIVLIIVIIAASFGGFQFKFLSSAAIIKRVGVGGTIANVADSVGAVAAGLPHVSSDIPLLTPGAHASNALL